METIYYVFNPNGRAPFTSHKTRADADNEAECLALANPGKYFEVLQRVARCKKGGVQWE
jgi:hypothetical protein